MDFSAELLRQVAIDATGGTEVEFDGQKIDFGSVARFTMREALVHYWEGDGKPTLDDVANPEWLRQHSGPPHIARDVVAVTDLGQGILRMYSYPIVDGLNEPIEGQHRSYGYKDHSTAPQYSGPPAWANCGHWVSHTSAK